MVALHTGETIDAVVPSHGVQQAVDDGHTYTNTPRRHRGYYCPSVRLRVKSEIKHTVVFETQQKLCSVTTRIP